MTTIPDTPELEDLLYRLWCLALDAHALSNEEMSDVPAEQAEAAYLRYQKRALAAAKADIEAYATAQADRARQEAFTLGFKAATEAANGTMLGTTWEESKKIIEVNQKSHHYDDLSNKGEAK